jgi:hypothetical protein
MNLMRQMVKQLMMMRRLLNDLFTRVVVLKKYFLVLRAVTGIVLNEKISDNYLSHYHPPLISEQHAIS